MWLRFERRKMKKREKKKGREDTKFCVREVANMNDTTTTRPERSEKTLTDGQLNELTERGSLTGTDTPGLERANRSYPHGHSSRGRK
jgi:hypothetical protein